MDWIAQLVVPVQRSASVNPSPADVVLRPTAVHSVGDEQETARRREEAAPAGMPPFQCSE